MASGFNHITDFLKGYGSDLLILTGSFDTNAASNPASPQGGFYTVARTGTGVYTVTFNDILPVPLFKMADLSMGAVNGSYARCGAFTASSGGSLPTLVIQTNNTGDAAADIAAAAGNLVNFVCAFKLYSEARP